MFEYVRNRAKTRVSVEPTALETTEALNHPIYVEVKSCTGEV